MFHVTSILISRYSSWRRQERRRIRSKGLRMTLATNFESKEPKKSSGDMPAPQEQSSSHAASASLETKTIKLLENAGGNLPQWNRIHCRVILSDCEKPIYRASSQISMLTALEGGI